MLDCTHILEIVPSPTQSTQATVQLNNPPNVWHKNQERIFLSPTQATQTTVQLYSTQIFGKKSG